MNTIPDTSMPQVLETIIRQQNSPQRHAQSLHTVGDTDGLQTSKERIKVSDDRNGDHQHPDGGPMADPYPVVQVKNAFKSHRSTIQDSGDQVKQVTSQENKGDNLLSQGIE